MENIHSYEIRFQDSPEKFIFHNARIYCVDGLLALRTFDGDNKTGVEYYPLCNIYRIKEIG